MDVTHTATDGPHLGDLETPFPSTRWLKTVPWSPEKARLCSCSQTQVTRPPVTSQRPGRAGFFSQLLPRKEDVPPRGVGWRFRVKEEVEIDWTIRSQHRICHVMSLYIHTQAHVHTHAGRYAHTHTNISIFPVRNASLISLTLVVSKTVYV
jgi:hypothetical protein